MIAIRPRQIFTFSFLLLLVVTIVLFSRPAQSLEKPPLITVTAEGKTSATPDQATLSLQFSETRLEASEARNLVDQQVARLIAVLENYAIKEQSLDTSQIHIQPQYDYRNNQREFRGYQVVRQVGFSLSDLSQLDALLKSLTENEVNQLNQIEFGLSKPAFYQHQALKHAMANAKATATRIAQGFGVTLGKIHSVSYQAQASELPQRQARMQMELASVQADSTYQQKDLDFMAHIQVAFTFE